MSPQLAKSDSCDASQGNWTQLTQYLHSQAIPNFITHLNLLLIDSINCYRQREGHTVLSLSMACSPSLSWFNCISYARPPRPLSLSRCPRPARTLAMPNFDTKEINLTRLALLLLKSLSYSIVLSYLYLYWIIISYLLRVPLPLLLSDSLTHSLSRCRRLIRIHSKHGLLCCSLAHSLILSCSLKIKPD